MEPSSDPPVSRSRRPGVTISQVAAAAGVSTATVSRVMSGRGYVSDATRRRVLATVERVGYRPSASARGLRTTHTASLGVLIANLANPAYLPFIRGVEHVAEAHGYAVLIADSRRSPDVERHELDSMYAHRVEALIVGESVENPEHLETLARVGLRVFRAPDAGGDAPAWSATAIEAPAIVAACAHLARVGHRRVAYVAAPVRRPHDPRRTARHDLIVDTLSAHRVALEAFTVPTGEPPETVASAVRAFLARPDAPTALLCATHPLAPTLLRALADADVALPDQVSFVTFGDSPWAAAYRPAIAVIRREAYAEGRAVALRLLYDLGVVADPGPARPPAATFDARRSITAPALSPPG